MNIQKNQELLQKFFLNANEIVRVGGQVHVALKRGKPYDLWNTQGLAHRTSGCVFTPSLPGNASGCQRAC